MSTEKEVDKILEYLDPDIVQCSWCHKRYSLRIRKQRNDREDLCIICYSWGNISFNIFHENNGEGKKWLEDLYLNKYDAYINDQGFASLREK